MLCLGTKGCKAAPPPHASQPVCESPAATQLLLHAPVLPRSLPQDSPDTFAVMTLYDPHRKPIPNIEYRTGGGGGLPAILPLQPHT